MAILTLSLFLFIDCRNAKGIIKTLNVPDVGIIELDEDADGADIQNYLFEKTGQKTVPSIFIDGKHIGGSSDLASLESSGELKKLVAA